ncbi:MAG TPA: GNAT family N-acetyltransferase [Chitinispirillaceae bacterium]|nr:GNAT family N-acetyltransferase [Chitinispirillaceae bacterium]
MLIRRYTSTDKILWNDFVGKSKNGTFLLNRNYMDYHEDRFPDHSLLFFDDKNQLCALLPASSQDTVYVTHPGLTYGGFITDSRMTATCMLTLLNSLLEYLLSNNFSILRYKTMPSIYHQLPAEEDRYALFRAGAILFRRDVLSVLYNTPRPPYQLRRLRSIKKANNAGVSIGPSMAFEEFWKILTTNLETFHNVTPVHSVKEISMLAQRFPDNIKLYTAQYNNSIEAGVVVYESARVAHFQYNATSSKGRKNGALDILIDHIIRNIYRDKPFIDFGISNENNGSLLNIGLVTQKEGFGARTIVHDYYELSVSEAFKRIAKQDTLS